MDTSRSVQEHDQLVSNPYLTVIICGSDEVMVKHGGRSRFSQMIRDDGKSGLLAGLLRHFSAPQTAAGVRAAGSLEHVPMEDLLRILTDLRDAHVLISPREHLTHVYLTMQFGAGAASAIGDKSVGFAGVGSLGGRVCREIARFRPRALAVLDGRAVGPHDRSYFDVPAELLTVGTPYTTVAARLVESAGDAPVAVVEGDLSDSRALGELFGASDFVVAALESYSPAALHAINHAALTAGKPWMSVFVDGSEAHIGPLYVPGETLCYNEFEIQNEAGAGLKEDYLLYREARLDGGALQAAHLVLPPFLSVVSGWAATTATAYLASGRSVLASRSLRLDFERLSVDYQDVLKLPRCPACATLRPAYRHTYL